MGLWGITGKGNLGKPESPIQGSRGSLDNGTRESYREIYRVLEGHREALGLYYMGTREPYKEFMES